MKAEGVNGAGPESAKGFDQEIGLIGSLMRIEHRFMGKCFSQMTELGLYPGQIPVMGLVARNDGISQKEIAEHLRIKPPTVNVSVQRLEKAGLLCRRQDERDQRVSRIYLTEKGIACKNRAIEQMRENEKIILDGFSEAELCLFRRFLDQVSRNIDNIPGSAGKELTK